MLSVQTPNQLIADSYKLFQLNEKRGLSSLSNAIKDLVKEKNENNTLLKVVKFRQLVTPYTDLRWLPAVDKDCDIFCTKSFMPFAHIFECALPGGYSIHIICISNLFC